MDNMLFKLFSISWPWGMSKRIMILWCPINFKLRNTAKNSPIFSNTILCQSFIFSNSWISMKKVPNHYNISSKKFSKTPTAVFWSQRIKISWTIQSNHCTSSSCRGIISSIQKWFSPRSQKSDSACPISFRNAKIFWSVNLYCRPRWWRENRFWLFFILFWII